MADERQRFADLYRRTYRAVYAYARRRANADTAAEATDEAYLIAWRKFAVVPEDALPWLIVTVRNVLSDLHRRNGRQHAIADYMIATNTAGQFTSQSTDESVVEKFAVLTALSTLSDSDRETLMLTAWDGLTATQAARVVGCSPPSFAVRHHRARMRLESALAKADSDQSPSKTSLSDRSQP